MADSVLQGVLFGGLSLIGWGLLDFLLKLNVARVGPGRLFVGMQVAAVPVLAAVVWALHGARTVTTAMLGLLLLLAALYLVANLGLFQALARGRVGVVIPITASWSVATAVLGWAVLGDRLTAWQWLAVVGSLSGILLVSLGSEPQAAAAAVDPPAAVRRGSAWAWAAPGTGWALLSLTAFSAMNTLLKPVTVQVGAVATTLWLKALAGTAGWLGLVVLRLAQREKAPPLTGWDLRWFLLLGLLDAVGVLGFNLGVSRAAVGVVAPVAASSPLLTLTLAAVALKEPLSRRQWVGSGLVIVSLVALASLA